MRSRNTDDLSMSGVAELPDLVLNKSQRIARDTAAKKDGTPKRRIPVLLDIADYECCCDGCTQRESHDPIEGTRRKDVGI